MVWRKWVGMAQEQVVSGWLWWPLFSFSYFNWGNLELHPELLGRDSLTFLARPLGECCAKDNCETLAFWDGQCQGADLQGAGKIQSQRGGGGGSKRKMVRESRRPCGHLSSQRTKETKVVGSRKRCWMCRIVTSHPGDFYSLTMGFITWGI